MEINQANKPSEFICSICTWTLYLPVGICYCFKAENKKKSSGGMQQLQLNQTAKQSVFLHIQVRASSQTKGLERG